MSEFKRTGVWVAQWMEDLDLTPNQTRLYAEIFSLDAKGGCFASNEYLGKVLKLKRDTISRLISVLKKKGLVKQTGFDGRRRFLKPLDPSANSRSDLNSEKQDQIRNGVKCGIGVVSKADSYFEKKPFTKYKVHENIHNDFIKKGTSADWKEFLTWSEKQLSHSTSLALSRLTGPEVLTGWQLSYWKRFKGHPK
ncbi:helix-turn-helix domain-containing protein [Leptospira sp. 2 VSF19]|uniref:Helix-turn-helix domain-containing protein n=1 Tax=Leptospira soteropolitanensis TaxID=2950025 RepID=A0AAW5VKK2_9LEPT|nr:helix-turn-helix domain-containing protein [Leptospira soteropolitanensis]MCW7492492.1 helix-turn-helix domain-containing protein [Leptospira soteropolitanensis]MCW7500542.1 helix-turn-helix domain-containing protein [Leptospira soteropolitanensis]MCW7522788.1 helix-turn-helix domain-containing protein [Leptospira soteropolitanensis]MCW7526646.1 helix-turn-helix domain-containing protein [Leptospira soteropolitanensis]MCW7530512.1 helix-turn-helix domain-containing protein [Leptospira soter